MTVRACVIIYVLSFTQREGLIELIFKTLLRNSSVKCFSTHGYTRKNKTQQIQEKGWQGQQRRRETRVTMLSGMIQLRTVL